MFRIVRFAAACCIAAAAFSSAAREAGSVPIIYTTDLYHPHNDPDDHFDLATLFGLPEFDIRAIVIDMGQQGIGRPGLPPIRQMMHMTGRDVPVATGLQANLESQADTGERQPVETQGGVDLILRVLRESASPVTLFAVGSMRDIAAAYNRAPGLFAEKAGRIYVNAGNTAGAAEWNVQLDPHAYVRLLDSGLPIYWVPCFGADGFESFWQFRQEEVLEQCPPALQQFFVYALEKTPPEKHDPITALGDPISAETRARIWGEMRNMWCTGAFLHAAGRAPATCRFTPASVHLDNDGTTRVTHAGGIELMTFHRESVEAYDAEMTDALKEICAGFAAGARR